MSSLASEIKEWNTPILGAYLLWKYTKGYETSADGRHPEFLLHFVALPILMSPELSRPICRQRKSFASYAASFSNEGQSDVLAKLDQMVFEQRANTMTALEIAIASHLLRWTDDKQRLCALKVNEKEGVNFVSKSNLDLGKKAFLFGSWSAYVPLSLFATSLGVKLT